MPRGNVNSNAHTGKKSIPEQWIDYFYGSDYSNDKAANERGERVALEEYNNAQGAQKEALTGAQQQNAPWIQAGQQALQKYQGLDYNPERFDYSQVDFYRDPSYQFRLQQGIKAMDQSAAARGKALSGQQLMATQQYGQNLASQEYANAYNRAMQANQVNNALNRQYFADKLGQYGTTVGLGYQAGQSNVNAIRGYGNNMSNIYGARADIRYKTPQLNKADLRYNKDRQWNMLQGTLQQGANLASGAMSGGANALTTLLPLLV